MLTIGFARRVPSYKRLTLMLRDPERLKALLLDPERPVQLVIAGKAHPADDGGKQLIQQMVRFADDPDVRHRIVFLPDYDIGMAQHLYPGCDVWLNNPLRPLEACGTSGMKAALNGGLNLSILDGWWDEWFDGENGWAIPTADGVDDAERRDDLEARGALRPHREPGRAAVLRRRRRAACRSAGWRWCATRCTRSGPKVLATPHGARLRRSSSTRRPPVHAALARRRLHAGQRAGRLEGARSREAWPSVAVDHVETASDARRRSRSGQTLNLRAFVSLGDLTPDDVDGAGRARPGRRVRRAARSADVARWRRRSLTSRGATASTARCLHRTGAFGYTVRVVPTHRRLADPTELGLAVLPVHTPVGQ